MTTARSGVGVVIALLPGGDPFRKSAAVETTRFLGEEAIPADRLGGLKYIIGRPKSEVGPHLIEARLRSVGVDA